MMPTTRRATLATSFLVLLLLSTTLTPILPDGVSGAAPIRGASAVDDENEYMETYWERENATTEVDNDNPFGRITFSTLIHGIGATGPGQDTNNVETWEVHICRFNRSGDFHRECWAEASAEWTVDGFDSVARGSQADGTCQEVDIAFENNALRCNATIQELPNEAGTYTVLTEARLGHGSLGSDTFLQESKHITIKEPFGAEDHSLATMSETQTNELVFWTVLLAFAFWRGWTLLALVFSIGWLRPLFETPPVDFKAALALAFVATWAYFIAMTRLKDTTGREGFL